ncbi:MAG: hypothetical protein EOO20_12455 [Chryseobacterium sp.]|nr:MAG: hypothetical protein EOO20_12455 [Chryseobacterium sp.]
MKLFIVLLMLVSTFGMAQHKIPMKEAIPEAGLLNKKIKGTKWYFDTYSIYEGKLDLNNNEGQPDVIHFVDENKFLVTLEDKTMLSGTYQIFDLHDLGVHNAKPNNKTFRINKIKNPSSRAEKLMVFLEQKLNVHYDLEQKIIDFMSDEIQPVTTPAN